MTALFIVSLQLSVPGRLLKESGTNYPNVLYRENESQDNGVKHLFACTYIGNIVNDVQSQERKVLTALSAQMLDGVFSVVTLGMAQAKNQSYQGAVSKTGLSVSVSKANTWL